MVEEHKEASVQTCPQDDVSRREAIEVTPATAVDEEDHSPTAQTAVEKAVDTPAPLEDEESTAVDN